ncbi:Restin -like protein [Halotydeus destructor]|nr:Restin -like protein [Halotydeus destructor]
MSILDTYYTRLDAGDKVLTMNTDDYMVGDRVWVNGVKPGYIQYIGDSKFAPGEWAGIVLDEPSGKNDGSVHGRRYFYCEPNRGVFARLWRLTRYPLLSDKYRSPSPSRLSATPDSGIYGVRAKSPDLGRGVSFLTTKPAKTVTTVTTTTTTLDPSAHKSGPLRVGDKVLVGANKGLLAGRLRYMGSTDFAPGYWAGIELDEPLGKNDGSVSGRRYFWCPNHYGLFAPSYKVVKADPKKMTTVTRITRASPEI